MTLTLLKQFQEATIQSIYSRECVLYVDVISVKTTARTPHLPKLIGRKVCDKFRRKIRMFFQKNLCKKITKKS